MKYLLITTILLCTKVFAQTNDIQKADDLYLHGNYSKAVELYSGSKDSTKVFDKIAKAYIALGNYDKALINYEKSIKVDPENALLKYDYAKLLAKVKKHEEAAAVLNALIDVDYRNPNYHYELGLVLEQMKDSTAQNRFYSAFQLDRTHQKAIFKLAKHKLQKRKHKQVDYYVDIGLESYENNASLISLKAQNFYWKENYDYAVIWFEKLLALNESSQFIHEKLSFAYAKTYEYEKAIEHCINALKYDPKNVTNLYILGQLYERSDDFENAEKYLEASIMLQDVPLDSEYMKLGYVYNLQKKQKEAIEAYTKATKENPNNDRAHYFLVLSKDKYYKDIDTRLKLYEAYIKRFPKSLFKKLAERRVSELKKEKFLKED